MTYPPVRYRDAEPQHRAALRRGDAPPELVGGATEIGYLATRDTTDGGFGLYRYVMTGPPTGPAPHFHRTISESFFVLSGQVRLFDGTGWTDAGAGDLLHVPVGSVHAFRNESGRRAEMLLLFVPGAPREAYFEALAERAASGREFGEGERVEFLRSHDQYEA